MSHPSYNITSLIIVGGGIFGSAIAYYYKKENPDKEVVVYERGELCSGNTSRAAALLSRVRPYSHVIPLSIETYRVIAELENITGDRLPVSYNGALHLASNSEESKALAAMLGKASGFGIGSEYISASEAAKMAPWLDADSAEKIAFIPGEAITDSYLLGMAFATAARIIGVKFVRNTEVSELLKYGNQVTGIRTNKGVHSADKVVLSAGIWSINLAYNMGIGLPFAPVRSQYWITDHSESQFPVSSPTVLIPAANFYARPQGNSLLFGVREAKSVYADPKTLPDDINSYKFSNDNGWQDLEEGWRKFSPFFPGFDKVGIKSYVAGFSGYTPDNQFVLGEVDGIDGILLATGCAGAGISIAGGVGLGISRLAGNHPNPFNFEPYRHNRFGSIDPYSPIHLANCAAARSKKTSG